MRLRELDDKIAEIAGARENLEAIYNDQKTEALIKQLDFEIFTDPHEGVSLLNDTTPILLMPLRHRDTFQKIHGRT